MGIEFYDRRGRETDGQGNRIIRSLNSSPGNRASSENVIAKKPKTKGASGGAAAAAPASPPPPPPKGNK